MNRTPMRIAVAALVVASNLQFASAALVSSTNVGGIIAAPVSVEDDAATNTQMEGFDEAQGVLLASDLTVDAGTISSGMTVDSHMIFLNSQGSTRIAEDNVTWTFDGPILGVMSDTGGTLEAATSALLGAAGTTYPAAFSNRGLEGNSGLGSGASDGYAWAGNQLGVDMTVTEPGDWIRVVTKAPSNGVPDSPLGTGMVAFALTLGMVAARRQTVAA